jgi:hypothetical protein
VPKLVWRVKLVAELRPGVMTETEVARIERDEEAGLADLGLRLAETKQLTAALQAEIVPAQVAVAGECRRCCSSCGRELANKGHYPVTFRSLFGDVPVRVRRLLVCPCQGPVEVKSFGVLDLGHNALAPELAYVTARYAALVPFGKVAVLLSELLFAEQRSAKCGNGPKQDTAGGRESRAPARHRDGAADHERGGSRT